MTFEQIVDLCRYDDKFSPVDVLKNNNSNNFLINNDCALSETLLNAKQNHNMYFICTNKTKADDVENAIEYMLEYSNVMINTDLYKDWKERYGGGLFCKNIELINEEQLNNIAAVFMDCEESLFIVTNNETNYNIA